jgi:predicted RNase H-like HicB family nuclease
MGERTVILHFRTYPEDQLWVGECVELDVASGGQTEQEAQRRVEEATDLYLTTLAEHGDLERVLAENGVQVVLDGEPVAGHFHELTVSLPLSVR